MKTLLLIVNLFLLSSSAQNVTDQGGVIDELELPTGIYTVQEADYVLGYSSRLIGSGIPIGKLKSENKSSGQAPDTPEELGQAMREAISENKRLSEKMDQEQAETLKELESVSPQEPVVSPSEPPVTEDVVEFKPRQFKECAEKSLPLLKQRMRLMHLPEELFSSSEEIYFKERTLAMITSELSLQQAPGGLVCGSHLPLLQNVVVTSDTNQIKILSALSNRQGREQRALMEILKAAFHSESPVDVQKLWRWFWARTSVVAAFTDSRLPSKEYLLEELKREERHEVQSPSLAELEVPVLINMDATLPDLDEAFLAGEAFLEDDRVQ